ncbi:lipopolysaccharide cholinephosphotransferase [Alkalibacterium subtropicum]|uniref:Lipopolysaccharide cholinephosphotransferase n=1 Tax=Alkalibacterium subtropicum TaxID=753702 RepID=A0A1I1GKM7_9LACT|nr:LicD family protein [Alkalibacterium subtropicum]SFC09720.1 lipopolysaccharide cholinephosphotransferase [Alkalibacterium subtropicum]
MKKITLADQKKNMLEILLYIDQIASDNHLTYSLWGGTMLGAVRHKGYIPWDDDIDISLPRHDYEKLIDILKNKDTYDLYEYSLQEDYNLGWAKLVDKKSIDLKKKYFDSRSTYGISVDIMPIDGLPPEEKEIQALKKKLYRLYLMVRSSAFPSYASSIHSKEACMRLALLFPVYIYTKIRGGKTAVIKEIDTLSKRFRIDDSVKCGHLLSRYKSNMGYPSSIWEEIDEYEFEGFYFKGIADAHTYLSLLYGDDYMEIPPKEKQMIHEEHEFYRKEGLADEYSDDNGQWQRAKNGTEYS